MKYFKTVFLTMVLAVAFNNSLIAQCPDPTPPPPVIDLLTATESRCATSGTITVTASGAATPFTYAITAGPITRPSQSSNFFDALPAGTYTVRVSDACGQQVFGDVDVTGTYVVPDYTPIATPEVCQGANTGTIDVTMTGGRLPFDYSLIAPSPVTETNLDVNASTFQFDNLPPGDFRVQVVDSCGNIQTRDVTIAAWTDPITKWATRAGVTKICGLPQMYELKLWSGQATITEGDPLEFRVYDAVTMALLASGPHVPNTNPSFTVPAPTDPAQGYIIETYDPTCDRIIHTFTQSFIPTTINYDIQPSQGECSLFRVYMSPVSYQSGRSLENCDATTWTITDTDTNTELESAVTNNWDPPANHSYEFLNIPAGNYEICMINCCDEQFCETIVVEEQPKTISSNFLPRYACMNESSRFTLKVTNFSEPYDLILESAPASITTAEGTFPANYNAGDVLLTQTYNGDSFHEHAFSNLGVGTYVFRVEDACGTVQSISVDVTAADLHIYSDDVEVVPGCAGANKVIITVEDNEINALWRPAVFIDNIRQNSNFLYNGSQVLEFINLPSGELRVEIERAGEDPFYGTCPQVFTFEETIPVYVAPTFASAIGVDCSGLGTITAQVENGIDPSTYELVDGPELRAAQASGIFENLPIGTYKVQILDACLNSSETDVTIGALLPPELTVTPFDCTVGGARQVTIVADSIFNAIYSWVGPGGYTADTRTIVISNPPGDFIPAGTYVVTATIPGCGSPVVSTFAVDIDCQLPVELSYFGVENTNGGVLAKWTTESETENLGFTLDRRVEGTEAWSELATYQTNDALLGQGSTPSATDYEYLDALVAASTTYEYRLADVDYNNTVTYHATRTVTVNSTPSAREVPDEFTVKEAYPNPFNPSTTIEYYIPLNPPSKGDDVVGGISVQIYDITGKLINTLIDQVQPSGWHSVQWNGKDQVGANVPAGAYLVRVKAGTEVRHSKVMLLK